MAATTATADFSEDRTLWMGDLASYMDSNFIGEAFRKMGIEVKIVKVIFDKYSGKAAGYCFVELPDTETARKAMLTVNGKIIPDSKPPVQFKLSFATGHSNPNADYSILVSNLPQDVDDALLFNIFGNRYDSCRGTRVFRNPDGSSKGSGYVRFADQTQQQMALVELNRFSVFGKQISLRLAPPRVRPGRFGNAGSRRYDPSNYYNQYQDYYNSNQYQPYDLNQFPRPGGPRAPPPGMVDQRQMPFQGGRPRSKGSPDDDVKSAPRPALPEHLQPEDYGAKVNVDIENKKFLDQSEDLYLAMEDSNWFAVTSASLKIEDL